MTITIAEITRYPVKSAAGVSVRSALVKARGLANDRRFMLVGTDGRFLTARKHPRLLRVSCREVGTRLCVAAPGMDDLLVTIDDSAPVLPVTVWNSTLQALVASDTVNNWFSEFLGIRCRLVFMGPRSHRAVDPAYGRPGDEVSFADGYPILVLSFAAMEALNARLDHPLGIQRFRPNLVLQGCAAHAEDGWRRIRIGGKVELELVKRCSRCVLTTLDPSTGERHAHQEPLRALAAYRSAAGGKVCFGMNAIPRRTGRVSIGDPVTVLEAGHEV